MKSGQRHLHGNVDDVLYSQQHSTVASREMSNNIVMKQCSDTRCNEADVVLIKNNENNKITMSMTSGKQQTHTTSNTVFRANWCIFLSLRTKLTKLKS